jgi:signal transduction histidine kinase
MPSRPPSVGSWPWLRDRLVPRGTHLIQWASYVILLSLLVLYVLTPRSVSLFAYYSTLTALALLLAINFLIEDMAKILASEQASIWLTLFISAALCFYVLVFGRMFSAIYIILMIAAQANSMLPSRPAVIFSAFLGCAFLGIFAWSGASPEEFRGMLLGILISLTFVITLSQVLLRYSEQTDRANLLLEQLKLANTELLAARKKEKELAIAEERVRVARDLHDGLGHHLTALSIQIQAVEKLLRANPDLAAEAVHNARGEVQAALQEVRQSVATLREAPVDIQDLPQAVARLVEEIGKRTGLETQFTLQGSPPALSAAVAMTLYRAVQEGLTNVQKHAVQATTVRVRLVFQPGQVSLLVEDNGQVAPADCSAAQKGFGLAGLRERASLLGGSIQCGPQPEGGFHLEILLPLAAQAQEGQGI